mmetsp:Transcript_18457/g.26040  ORF Transcript_18457/g.26040 Transcript_18457/m.26040 type:complete len:105 (+) Transcript_18457:528-842(+)
MGHKEPLRAQLTKSSTREMVYSTVSFVSTPPMPPLNSSMLSNLFKADVVEEACDDIDRRAPFAAVEEATILLRRADDRKADEIMVDCPVATCVTGYLSLQQPFA